MRRCPLGDAVSAMLPGGILLRRTEQDWHSASFSGARVKFDFGLPEGHRAQVAPFEAALSDHEYALPGKLVVDIIVSGQREVPGGLLLIVEALLLSDDA
jgi:hypothetical protein